MQRYFAFTLLAMAMALPAPAHESLAALTEQVRAAGTAFAKTMADRDLAAFQRFLAPDAVFVEDPIVRGAEAIAAAWREYFTGAAAPFTWAPDTIAVLDSGRLALSSGSVLGQDG